MLASVALALAGYQLVLIAVGYGKLRPRLLSPAPASKAHRASGDAIVVCARCRRWGSTSLTSRAWPVCRAVSLDRIKAIKSELHITVNDVAVVCGGKRPARRAARSHA